MKRKTDRSRRLLACIGNSSRWRVVAALARGDLCVTELASRIDLSQSCTTRHLQALVREGVVGGRREGKRVMFALRRDDPLLRELLDWALPGAAPAQVSAAEERTERRKTTVRSDDTPARRARADEGPVAVPVGGAPGSGSAAGFEGGSEGGQRGNEKEAETPDEERSESRQLPPGQDDIEDWLL